MTENNLRQYFVQAASLFNWKFKEAARRDLRRMLYKSASSNGKCINSFFPELNNNQCVYTSLAPDKEKMDIDDDDDDDDDEEMGNNNNNNGPKKDQQGFDWLIVKSNNDKGKIDPSHPGRPCVRKFKQGEPTYRCL